MNDQWTKLSFKIDLEPARALSDLAWRNKNPLSEELRRAVALHLAQNGVEPHRAEGET